MLDDKRLHLPSGEWSYCLYGGRFGGEGNFRLKGRSVRFTSPCLSCKGTVALRLKNFLIGEIFITNVRGKKQGVFVARIGRGRSYDARRGGAVFTSSKSNAPNLYYRFPFQPTVTNCVGQLRSSPSLKTRTEMTTTLDEQLEMCFRSEVELAFMITQIYNELSWSDLGFNSWRQLLNRVGITVNQARDWIRTIMTLENAGAEPELLKLLGMQKAMTLLRRCSCLLGSLDRKEQVNAFFVSCYQQKPFPN